MSKIDIYKKVKELKPTVSERVLRNHRSVYNVCFKHFKNDDFINKPEEVKKFYLKKYKNIKSRKSNFYILKTVAISLDKKDIANKFDGYAKEINKFLENEKKKMLEKIDKPAPVVKPEDDEWDLKFKEIKNCYLKIKKEAQDLFKENKKAHTIEELKKFRNYAIASFYCACFCEDDLYCAKNPPRRNEIRNIIVGNSMKIVSKGIFKNNIILRPVSNIPIFKTVAYGDYKKSAHKIHGLQRIPICKDISNAIFIYLKTHKGLITDKLFVKNLYFKNKEPVIFNSEAWSKLLKRLLGYSCNEIRKTFVTRTYKTIMPQNNAIKQLAYRMGHSFQTAIEHYNKIPKVLK
jgi:hypothetical protein